MEKRLIVINAHSLEEGGGSTWTQHLYTSTLFELLTMTLSYLYNLMHSNKYAWRIKSRASQANLNAVDR